MISTQSGVTHLDFI